MRLTYVSILHLVCAAGALPSKDFGIGGPQLCMPNSQVPDLILIALPTKLTSDEKVRVTTLLAIIMNSHASKQDFLLSLKLFEELIETDFGTKDDILFLNYADLHIKLLVSSNSNFCFDPFSLKERLNFLINENKDSQNFLLNAYLDELSDFFQKNSSFYLNLLNHYNEEDLKTLFNNEK